MSIKLLIFAGVFVLGVLAGGSGTGLAIKKFSKPLPPCPACNCPPSTVVEVGTLDFEQLRKVKGNLTVTQSLDHVTFLIQAKDSALVKQLLKAVK